MKTLEEHFDDLDRMVDCGASKPAIRDQIAFLWKQVATLDAERVRAIAHDAQTTDELMKLQTAYDQLKQGADGVLLDSAKAGGEDVTGGRIDVRIGWAAMIGNGNRRAYRSQAIRFKEIASPEK